MGCTTEEIKEDDDLSNKICYRCQESAIVCWEFKEKAMNSERYAMELMNENEEIVEDELLYETEEHIKDIDNHKKYYEEHLSDHEGAEICVESEDINYEAYDDLNDSNQSGDQSETEKYQHPEDFDSLHHIHDDIEVLPIIIEKESYKKPIANVSQIKTFPCDLCSEVFPSPLLLNFHAIKHDSSKKQRKIQKTGDLSLPVSNKITYEQDGTGRFICHICQGTYRTRDNLSRHIVKHNSEKNFKCELCPREFYFQRDLNGHVKQQHSKVKQKIACIECSSDFSTSSALKKHSLLHKTTKNFNCDQCSQSFKSKGALQRHYRIHSGDKPFACVRCSKAFTQKIVLQRHMKRVHDEFIYGCEWCNLSFERHGQLREHWKECENLKNRGGYEVIFVSQDGLAIDFQEQDESAVQSIEVDFAED